MNPAPDINFLSQPEKVDYFICENDMNMQDYILTHTKPSIENHRDWHFVPLNPKQASIFPDRPPFIQQLNETLE